MKSSKMTGGDSLKSKSYKSARESKASQSKASQSTVRPSTVRPSTVRKSTRGKQIEWIPSLTLGLGSPANEGYNKQLLTEDVIQKFVNEKLKEGYQQVAMPMPPDESHSIIVYVEKVKVDGEKVEVDGEKSIVKIVDWGGIKNKTRKELKIYPTINDGHIFNKWFNYTTFIKCLEKKYSVEYVEIDEEEDIYTQAYNRYEKGLGGCSEYLDGWVKQNLTDNGKVAVLLAVNGQEKWK